MVSNKRSALIGVSLYNFLSIVSCQAVAVQISGLNPASVPLDTRNSWCASQQQTCGELCIVSSSSINSQLSGCNAESLSWTCACVDGSSPSMSQYADSLNCLATNYQLGICLKNATVTPAACHISYNCLGLSTDQIPGNAATPSTSSTTSTSSSTTSNPISSASPSSPPTSSTSDGQLLWVVAPVLIITALLIGLAIGLWCLKKKKLQPPQRPHIRVIRHNSEMNGSGDHLRGKAELDGSESIEMQVNTQKEYAELEGSTPEPAELEGCTPTAQPRPFSWLPTPPRLFTTPRRPNEVSPVSPGVADPHSGSATPVSPETPGMMSPQSGPLRDQL